MEIKPLIHTHLKEFYARPIVLIYLLTSILLVAVVVFALTQGINMGYLMDDIASTAQLAFYAGFLNYIIILLWAVSGTVSLFAHQLLKSVILPSQSLFLRWSSIISWLFWCDDIFMMHEAITQSLSIAEVFIYFPYLLLVLFYLLKHKRIILETNFLFLGLSIFLLSISTAIDVYWIYVPLRWQTGIEEAFKLFGVVTWAVYHCKVAFLFVKSAMK
jgi:hypothetical protein